MGPLREIGGFITFSAQIPGGGGAKRAPVAQRWTDRPMVWVTTYLDLRAASNWKCQIRAVVLNDVQF